MSYMTVDGVIENIGSALKSGLDFYGKSQADAAAADLARAQAAAGMQAGAPASGEGFPTMTVVLIGGAAVAAWMLLKKKKSP